MKKGFYEIEKHIRKNQNKLRKLHLMVKDKEEESRSIKNISQHRLKRSISRTKKDNSPRNNNSYSSVPRGPNRKNTTGQLLLAWLIELPPKMEPTMILHDPMQFYRSSSKTRTKSMERFLLSIQREAKEQLITLTSSKNKLAQMEQR